MVLPTGYNLLDYGAMVNSEPRMTAYDAALREAINPGSLVYDIGAGPGVFSLLACKYGARSVVAIEPDDSIELAGTFASANGYDGRITSFQGLSSAFSAPEKADVIVSDIRGILPLFEGHIPAIIDARERLLAPGGTLIPARDVLRVALVESEKSYVAYEEPWLRNKYDIDLSAGHRFATNVWTKVHLEADNLLSAVHDLATLDYYQIQTTDVAASVELAVDRRGTAHGLLIWFDAELAPGIGYSNEPGQPPLIYGQSFFPFERPVDVSPGDRVSADISARTIEGSYLWTWNCSLYRKDEAKPDVQFRQSSFLAKVLSRQSLRARAGDFVPPARAAHEVDRFCLSLIDGKLTQAEIAAAAQSAFPGQFANSGEALNHVVKLTNRYR